MTDDELYRAYLAGDAAAGDRLMLQYGDALTAYLAAFLHNAEDAEDLMIDCFTVILVDKPEIADGNFRAYLYRMARNKACRLWKRRYRLNGFSLDEPLMAAGGEAFADKLISGEGSPEEAALRRERSAALARCFARLAPQYREALWLFYDMDMSYAQAAGVLGRSVKQVEDLLRSGRKSLRAELEKEGITSSRL